SLRHQGGRGESLLGDTAMAKAKDPPVPRDTRLITTYSELREYITDFARRIYFFIWLEGRAGTGKSKLVEFILNECKCPHYHLKSGTITPLSLYQRCHEHVNQPIVLDLDELESMIKDTNGRRLLLALGETIRDKTLYWQSTTLALGNTPAEFE